LQWLKRLLGATQTTKDKSPQAGKALPNKPPKPANKADLPRQNKDLLNPLQRQQQGEQIRQLVKQHPQLTIALLASWLKKPDKK
jgi:hypothetical protein